jgi:hypothetical protein
LIGGTERSDGTPLLAANLQSRIIEIKLHTYGVPHYVWLKFYFYGEVGKMKLS